MTALTKDRNTTYDKQREFIEVPVLAGETIYLGSMVTRVIASGYAKAASDSAGEVLAGVACGDPVNGVSTVDNSVGSNGDKVVKVRRLGVHEFAASGLAIDDVGAEVFIADDQTVQTGATTNNISAGVIVDFESATVAVIDIYPATLGLAIP